MLEVSGLEAGYGDGRVLFGVEFAVGAGEVVTLLGRNGMGKTTTLSAVMGIVRAQAGTIRLDGAPIHALPPYRIPRLGLGPVPEGRQVVLVRRLRRAGSGARAATQLPGRVNARPWLRGRIQRTYQIWLGGSAARQRNRWGFRPVEAEIWPGANDVLKRGNSDETG